jgi:hypothetical protein
MPRLPPLNQRLINLVDEEPAYGRLKDRF